MAPCTLIVDDDASHGQMLVEGLREAGWNAYSVTSVIQAISRVQHSARVSLVVSDIRMDDGNGFDLLRTIRELGNSVPVILMSSFGTGATQEEALAAGAYAYLPKPFALDDLVALVIRAHAEAS